MALNINTLAKDMLNAAKPVLQNYWKEAKPYVEKESKAFAQNLAMIAKLKLENKITKEEASLHIEIQKSSYRMVLLAVQGLGLIAVENALNAAIGVISTTVNKAIGWNLL